MTDIHRTLLVSATALAALTGCATDDAEPFDTEAIRASKVSVCHETGSTTNPYVVVEVATSAWSGPRGHGGHAGDFLLPTWFLDADGDGFGDASEPLAACEQPSGYVDDDTDCDDDDDTISPDADEICDELDNDCDGVTDEDDAIDAGTWYADADADGYGDDTTSALACEQPSGMVPDGGDCDDTEATTNPGADETCDGVDNDCDGDVDEDDAIDAGTWYHDGDADGYGDASDTAIACEPPTDFVDNGDDCDDTAATAWPGAEEVCDDLDNDCDGDIDEDEVCCVEADFSLDFTESWSPGFAAPAPRWSLSADQLTVRQSTNSNPAVYMTNLPADGFTITFQLQVQTSGDDDYIGWVVGFESGDATSTTSEWMLFDWKQSNQHYAGVWAYRGLAMSRVTGPPTSQTELWGHTGDVSEEARAIHLGWTGWSDYRTYTIQMTYTTSRIQVYVDGRLEFDESGTFPSGNFGFYTFSQSNGRFTLVDPIGTTCY